QQRGQCLVVGIDAARQRRDTVERPAQLRGSVVQGIRQHAQRLGELLLVQITGVLAKILKRIVQRVRGGRAVQRDRRGLSPAGGCDRQRLLAEDGVRLD